MEEPEPKKPSSEADAASKDDKAKPTEKVVIKDKLDSDELTAQPSTGE